MKVAFVVVFAAALLGLAAASDVVTLTTENFDSSLASASVALVEFYAPWCGHCKKLEPEWEAAATALADLKGTVMMGKVDATVESDLGSKFGIRGYPTIKTFRNGVESGAYEGPRTAKAIETYLRRQTQPAYTVVKGEDAVVASKSADLVAMAFVTAGSAEETVFQALAAAQRDHFTFAVVTDAATFGAFKVAAAPAVTLFRNKDGESIAFTGPFTEDALLTFVQTNALPLIDAIGPENYNAYVATKLPMGFLFVSLKPADKAVTEAAMEEAKATARALHGRAVFVYVDSEKYMQHGERLGLSGKVVPSFAVDTPGGSGKHWAYDETAPLTGEALTAFMNGVVDGSIAPTIKSAPVPSENSGPVTVVVASQFIELVMDPAKDVFIEFYAPWCGHCKKLEPVFETLGGVFASVESVVIAKMDATANDIPVAGVSVQGFPTLMLFPAGADKKPVSFEGDRTAAGMTEFIVKNAKSSFNQQAVLAAVEDEDVHDEL